MPNIKGIADFANKDYQPITEYGLVDD